jgi:predicted nucleic acid-binding protein
MKTAVDIVHFAFTMERVMKRKTKRIYIDSSVPSAMFDENDHPEKTRAFWQAVINGEVIIIASDVLRDELIDAPLHVQEYFAALPKSQIEWIESTDESNDLAERYVTEDGVGASSLNDRKHVALATVARADVIVSWNCKHIVKLNRIHRYNAINMLQGYPQIEIRTPYEVINDET